MKARFRAGALVALLACLAPATSASATTIKLERFPGTPALAGDMVLWTHYASDGDVALWSAVPGSPPLQVQRIDFPREGPPAGYLRSGLAASPALALLTTTVDQPTPGSTATPGVSRYHLGLAGRSLEPIAECRTTDFVTAGPAGDVWDEAYVYRQCDDGGGHVEVRDTAAEPLSPPRTVGIGGIDPRIAGRYVAWLDGPYRDVPGSAYDIVVYDRVADAELYRLARSEIGHSPLALDVQEDGKVAFVIAVGADGPGVGVAWASPEDPRVHMLPLPPRAVYRVRMAGDRVAYQGGDITLANAVQDAEVGVIDLGGARTSLARGTTALTSAESFDYDGERAVWRELGCQRWRLVVRSVEVGASSAGADVCPLRLKRPPAVRDKRARFGFECAPLEQPCSFDVELRIVGAGAVAGKALQVKNPVRIKLSRRAHRLLRRRDALRVRAAVTAYGEALPFDTFQQVRHGTLRLHAGRAQPRRAPRPVPLRWRR